MNKKNLLLLLAAAASIFVFLVEHRPGEPVRTNVPQAESRHVAPHLESALETAEVEQAIAHRARAVEVEGTGIVIKLLRDDVAGSQHQKFLLRLPSGAVVLIAHNIDLASRVENLRKGDTVDFRGEYVWNEKGGVIHWTHRDPHGRHPSGWLKHTERVYQ